MKFQRIISRASIILLAVTLLTLLTPLTCTNVWLRNIVCLLTGAALWVAAKQVKSKGLRIAMTWLPFIVFAFLTIRALAFSFANRITDNWRTSRVSHRQTKHQEIYIAEQMLDVGALGYARRTVKIIPVTPLFDWVTSTDTSKLDNSWMRVNEDYNPYNLKY